MKKIIILICLFSLTCFSQKQELKISFSESINLGKVDSKTFFSISSEYGFLKLIGEEINSYKFSKPGIYKIKIKEFKNHKKDDSCAEIHLPKEILVDVSNVRITFDGSNISFSKPIIKNVETTGTTLNIPITIESYNHLPAKMNTNHINTAGIGSSLIAKLNSEFYELSEGTHLISYSLNGVVTENSFIMFDFLDSNNKVQSVALQYPIKNNDEK